MAGNLLPDPDFLYLIPDPEDPIRPEKALIAAMLERAISDALRVVGKIKDSETPQGVSREAFKWIMRSQGTSLIPWTFEWVCETLNLDARHLRMQIYRAREAKAVYFRNDRLGKKNAHLKQFKGGYAA